MAVSLEHSPTRSSLQCSPHPFHATATDGPLCLFRTLLSTLSNAYCEGKTSVKHTNPCLSFQCIFPHMQNHSSRECNVSPIGQGVQIWHPTCQSTRGWQSSQTGSHDFIRSFGYSPFSLSDQQCLVRCTKSLVSGISIYSSIMKTFQIVSL